jgi:hypothetical protein
MWWVIWPVMADAGAPVEILSDTMLAGNSCKNSISSIIHPLRRAVAHIFAFQTEAIDSAELNLLRTVLENGVGKLIMELRVRGLPGRPRTCQLVSVRVEVRVTTS